MDDVGAAAGNNAQWCDLVCRAHGLPTSQQRGLWSTRRRSPAGYPDAVTLRRGVPPAGVLALVDDTPGCSVKDSFGDLDLAAFGFEVLFDAAWIHAAAATTAAEATVGWTLVTEAEEFAAWTAAAPAGDVLGPDLLGDPAVRVLVAHDGGGVRAGAIANRSAAVVGVSNVFSTTIAADAAWAGIVSTLSVCFPGLPLVGYELAADRPPALRAGFTEVGPLRVWLRRA